MPLREFYGSDVGIVHFNQQFVILPQQLVGLSACRRIKDSYLDRKRVT